jgi:hypothetical protein
MRKERSMSLEVLVLLVVLGFFPSPGSANSSIFCDLAFYGFSETENHSPDFVGSFLKSSSLELGKSVSASFVHDIRLAGGGGSGYKAGSKGSGKGYGYEGSNGSGGYKGSKGLGGYKDSQGKTESTGSKSAQDELKVEKEKNENSLPGKDLTPQHVNH